jgi:hypothetical protein
METVPDDLQGLRPDERAACLIVSRALNASARAWDVGGRQGAVDAMLSLPDGRTAALEIISLGSQDARQVAALLHRDDLKWPAVGAWNWTVQVGSAADIPHLRNIYAQIINVCEAAGVTNPDQMYRTHVRADPNVAWLLRSSSAMFGHPTVTTNKDDGSIRSTMVVPTGRSGGVDRSLQGLRRALEVEFQRPGITSSYLCTAPPCRFQ